MSSYNTLRAIANRLNTTPINELPHQVGYLATSLASCKDVLQGSSTGNTDHSVLIHKLKTRTSALLQDRSPEGRLSGIVIVRALVEAGGLSFVSESGTWVRNLITCLNKSDPWEVKRLSVVTIARIYVLTIPHQALIRDITTPTLPAFISASLTAIKPATITIQGKPVRALSPLLETVLTVWHALIEHFASTFRPYLTSIRAISLSLLSDPRCPSSVNLAAHRLLARLHYCAPRNSPESEWSQICAQAVEAAHDTADLIFRAIIEDWKPTISRVSKATPKQRSADIVSTKASDALDLDPWSGVSEGALRLIAHITLLLHMLTLQHAQAVQMPLGSIFDLTSRLSAVTLPSPRFSLRVNNEITRDEREELWLNIPRIHAAVLSLFEALIQTYGQALLPLADTISVQLWDILEAGDVSDIIRTFAYNLISAMLSHKLLHVSKSDFENISRLVNHCCDDLRIKAGLLNPLEYLNSNKSTTTTLSLSTTTNQNKNSEISPSSPSLYQAACNLLPLILTHLPFHLVPGSTSLRTNLDSTAILIQHHEAILASTLNPPQSRSKPIQGAAAPAPSLLPFLARNDPPSLLSKLAKEALLRPRMPTIRSGVNDSCGEDMDVDDLESEQQAGHVTNHTTNPNPNPAMHAEQQQLQHLPSSNIPPPQPLQSANAMEGTDHPSPSIRVESYHNNTTNIDSTEHKDVLSTTVPQTLLPSGTAQKRDFTALLEQSANAQLAADGVSPSQYANLNDQEEDEEEAQGVSKKPRILAAETVVVSGSAEYGGLALAGDKELMDGDAPAQEQDHHQEGIAMPVVSVDETRLYHDDDGAAAADSGALEGKEKGKAKSTMEDSDSSDSDIPPIDATLLAFSDSDEEDSDEDG